MPNPPLPPKRLAPVAVLRRLRVSELLVKSPVGSFWQGMVDACLDAYERAIFKVDDRVIVGKRLGFIVSVFPRLSGELVYVVEHDDSGLTFYSDTQLALYTEPVQEDDSAPSMSLRAFPLPHFNQNRGRS